MLKIASGTQNLRAKEAGAYELREVTRQFNAMLYQIDQLMADVRRQEETTRQYEIDENPAFDNLVLPKLVLQPLVENALYYGIKEKEDQGHIRVSVQKKDSGLVIRIEDDGVGFQAAADSSQSQLKRGGVGLQNVDQRLKLHFGDNYQMKINSVPEKGTTVEIYINRIETS